jgi:hypothetical protein
VAAKHKRSRNETIMIVLGLIVVFSMIAAPFITILFYHQ